MILPLTALDHSSRDGLADEENAVDVGRVEATPGIERKLGKWRAMLHACVVDEDVDGADPGLDVGDACFDRGRVGDVESGRVYVEALLLQGPLRLTEARRVARIQDQGRARRTQRCCQREADALAGAGDQRDAPGQIEELHARRSFK